MGLQNCYLSFCSGVLPSPNHNIRHIGRAVEPGSIKLNVFPCVWFLTLGLRTAIRLTATSDQPRGLGAG